MPNFLQYLQFISAFTKKANNFFKDACKIIENFCEAAKELKNSVFYNVAGSLILPLLETSFDAHTDMIYTNVGVSTLMSIFETAQNESLSLEYIDLFLKSFEKFKKYEDPEKR